VNKFDVHKDECAVYRDAGRHSCILLGVDRKYVRFVAYSPVELVVQRESQDAFFRRFEKTDYAPGRAAQRYLSVEDGYSPKVSAEVRTLLGRIADGKFDRKVELPDVDIPASTPTNPVTEPGEDDIMASAKTSAAKKAATPAKKAADKPAAKKSADKPAAKKAPAAEEAGTRGRKPNIDGSAKIKILVKENPKRAAAATRFALYKNGMTVDEYIAAGGTRADVNWDVKMEFIEVK